MKRLLFLFVFLFIFSISIFAKVANDYTHGKLKDTYVHYIDFSNNPSGKNHKMVFITFKEKIETTDIFYLESYQEVAYRQATKMFLDGGAEVLELNKSIDKTSHRGGYYHAEVTIPFDSIYVFLNRATYTVTIGNLLK